MWYVLNNVIWVTIFLAFIRDAVRRQMHANALGRALAQSHDENASHRGYIDDLEARLRECAASPKRRGQREVKRG